MTEFIRNAWYAVCWSDELGVTPHSRQILGKDLAVYRTANGVPAVVENCCPHRLAPMLLGFVNGENIVCGYHGMEFDRDGFCVSIPGQKNIPRKARIRTYPAVERYNLIWAWMGEQKETDDELIPDVHWLDAPGWTAVTGSTRYECNWLLLVDNLLDLTHTAFVHQSTIGTEDVANTPITTEFSGERVYVVRDMKNTAPSNLYKRIGGFDGRINRWQRIWLEPPSVVVIEAGAIPAKCDRDGADREYTGFDTRVLSILVPVDERTVEQLWAFARNTELDNPHLDVDIQKALELTFKEDADFLAGQQINMERHTHRQMLNNASDAGLFQTRRLIERWIADDLRRAGRAEL